MCRVDPQNRHELFIRKEILKKCEATQLEGKEEAVFSMIQKALHKEIKTLDGSFTLGEIASLDMKPEVEFFYPLHLSFMKGFIDLLIRFRGKYYLLDWKTNALEGYFEDNMMDCMQEKQYLLQAAIYAVALKKHLAIFDKRPFESCFGGAIYFFLRGDNYLLFKPDLSLSESLDGGEDLWDEE